MQKRPASSRLMYRGILAVLVLVLCTLPRSVQGMPTEPDQVMRSVPRQEGPTDPQELEAFLDAFFAEQVEKLHISGAVFVLVKDGEIFFAKGYGYADLENQTPVVPEKTVFRAGSVSKLFTATAVMQLYERGLLNLDDDVNKYLKHFQLEDNYPQPVTVANLLTHTGGFDERYIGMHARTSSDLIPLGQYLATRMPPRTMPPGEVIAYSDHGMSLAGYLVEEISDVPFAQYIDANIFQPLGMSRSSFQQPPPPHLASDLAVGYRYKNGTYEPYPFDYLNIVPAAALNATATDIARFMIAHLQDGRYGNTRILSEATVQEMHRQQFTHHPQLRGRACGFSERFDNNQRALFHDGGTPGFLSRLFLLPEHNLGFFVACNGDQFSSASRLPQQLTSQFLDHYYSVQEEPTRPQPPADFQSRASRFTSYYRELPYSRYTIEKLTSLLNQVPVTDSGNGTLAVGSSQYVEVEPLLFQRVDGKRYIAFREDDNGHITHMFIGTGAYEKLRWYEARAFQLGLIGFFVLAFLSACIVSLLPGASFQLPHLHQLPRLLVGLISALNLVFLIGLGLALFQIDQWEFTYGLPSVVMALLVIPIVTTILTVGLPLFAGLAWINGYWSLIGRLYYSSLTLAELVFIWWLSYWNLLGFRF